MFITEPRVVPQNFELDPDVPVTATSAGFRWDPVDTSPQSIRGAFQGYKVLFTFYDDDVSSNPKVMFTVWFFSQLLITPPRAT